MSIPAPDRVSPASLRIRDKEAYSQGCGASSWELMRAACHIFRNVVSSWTPARRLEISPGEMMYTAEVGKYYESVPVVKHCPAHHCSSLNPWDFIDTQKGSELELFNFLILPGRDQERERQSQNVGMRTDARGHLVKTL